MRLSVRSRVGLRRHGGWCRAGRCCRMAVLGYFLCAQRCGHCLREIRTHRGVAVFTCAIGLSHLEVALRLRFLVVGTGIRPVTRATLAAVAVARAAAIAVAVVCAFACAAFSTCLSIGFVLALGRRNRVARFV